MKKIIKYLNKEKSDILKASIVLFLVSFSYLAYLYYIGIPMTKAKNLYNQAFLSYQDYSKNKDPEDLLNAKNTLQASLDKFYSQEAQDLLNQIY